MTEDVKVEVLRETQDQGKKMGHSADDQRDNGDKAVLLLNFLLLDHHCNGTTLTNDAKYAGEGESCHPAPPYKL